MRTPTIGSARGERGGAPAVALVILVLLVLVPASCVAVKMMDSTAPTLTIEPAGKAIGRRPLRIAVEARDDRYGVTDLRATLVQGAVEIPLAEATDPGRPWWRPWGAAPPPQSRLETDVSLERIPELEEGPALILAEATNDSWARGGKGRTARAELAIPVRLTPPRLEVLSAQHAVTQGGSEAVRYRISETAEVSGVRVGERLFVGYPVPGAAAGERIAIFALPHDAAPGTRPVVVAADGAGNEAVVALSLRVNPRTFRAATLDLDDAFLQRVVPAILSRTPTIRSEGDLVKDFLQINGPLRRACAERLAALAAASPAERRWTGAFTQLGGSEVQAGFADRRTYRYRGAVIDRQDHLGYDLAVTEAHPIDAAASGTVVLAAWFGLYGNTVVIDHGWGLMTLYAHLSTIEVEEGERVEKGAVLGRSGSTGLAGGDHLHFSVLVQGVFVNPVEWWDAHWIHDRIEAKLGPASVG